MTRVLHVIETLGIGGAERLLLTLLPELSRQGVPSEVLALRGPFTLQPELEAAGVPVRQAASQAHRWHLPALSQSVARAARDMRADIIHAHLYFPAIGTALARIGGLARQRTAVTFHNLAYAPGVNQSGPGLTLRRWLAQRAYPRGIDLALGVSRAVADHYANALRLPRVEVSPNPVDLTHVQRITPATGAGPAILVPGRLVPEKGHDVLLDALAMTETPPGGVVFAGGGPQASALLGQANRLGIPVQVTGNLAHDDLLRLMASAEIVAVPSRAEGFGLVALEAMALGRPVVATTAGGLPEVIGDAGVLVAPEAPRALGNALRALSADPGRRAMLGAHAKRRAESFAVGPVASALAARYATLCEARP